MFHKPVVDAQTDDARGIEHHADHQAQYGEDGHEQVDTAGIALAAALAWETREFHVQKEVWRLKLQNAGARPDVPSFDELFRVPAAARADDQTDDEGDIVMPSRSAFETARLDALVLTHATLSALASGNITIEKAIADFEQMHEQLSEDSDISPFDNLRFGDADYMQAGDDQPLRMMFEAAIEKLQDAAEK